MRKRLCLGGGTYVYDEDICMKLVDSRFAGGRFCPTLNYYDRLQNGTRNPETGGRFLHEQRVCATHEFNAKREIVNTFVLMNDKKDEKEGIWM